MERLNEEPFYQLVSSLCKSAACGYLYLLFIFFPNNLQPEWGENHLASDICFELLLCLIFEAQSYY
jgi:hypothetical protein